MRVFDRLVEQGNSLLVIEHNIEVIKCADYVIDLGPEAGRDGGLVVAAGTPEEVAAVEESHTGRYLRDALANGKVAKNGKYASHDSHSSRDPARRRRRAGLPRRSPPADHRQRRARAQPQEHLRRHPARPVGGHHRPERLRQIDAGLRYSFCRRAAALSRFHVGVCAAVRGAVGEARGRSHRRAAADRRHRAAHHARRRQVDRRHGDGGLSFSAAALGQARHAVLPAMRSAGGKADARRRGEEGRGDRAQGPHPRARAAREGAQRLPHRDRALGRAPRFPRSAGRWQMGEGRRVSQAGALQGAHDRRAGRRAHFGRRRSRR